MIGTLEAEVLRTLQNLGNGSAREVLAHLPPADGRLAYTTVATVLARLHDKGLVRRRRQPCRGGARYVYHVADFEHKYLVNVLRGVVSLFGPSGVVHLNEELAKLQPSEERELRRRLKL